MKRTRKLLSLLLGGSLLLTLLAGCGGSAGSSTSGSGSSSGPKKDTFVVALDSDIVKLDPAFAYDFTTNPVVDQITQGLLAFDNNFHLQPMLAKSWKQVDSLTYVYEIRDDVTFSDGSPMTMDDVLYSLNRTRDPNVASYLGWMFDSVDTIKQTGDWELTVKLKTPDATWQYVPATTACHIISKKFAEAAGDKLGTPEGGLMGTGPYKYVSWKNGTEVDLTRNENYWNSDKPYFENLVFKIITEDTTRVTALQTGDVDCTVAPPYDMLDVLKSDKNITLETSPSFGVTYLAFNNARTPFNDARVRKAIYHAINFQEIQNNLVKDAGTAGTALPSSDALFTIEPDRWAQYASKLPTYDYNVDEAKDLLAQAGYANGFNATLCLNQNSLSNSIALAIQSDLAKVGINVTLNKVSTDEHTAYQFGDVLDDKGQRDYDMILAGWESDFPDPAGNLTPLYQSGNSANAAAYTDSQVDAYIKQQTQSSDPTQRNDLMFKAFDIITDQVPYIFVYYPIKDIAINKNYTGVVMNAAWSWNIRFQDARPAT